MRLGHIVISACIWLYVYVISASFGIIDVNRPVTINAALIAVSTPKRLPARADDVDVSTDIKRGKASVANVTAKTGWGSKLKWMGCGNGGGNKSNMPGAG